MKTSVISLFLLSSIFSFAEEKTTNSSNTTIASEDTTGVSADDREIKTIDREAVKRVIKGNMSLFKACYDTQYKKDSSLNGKVLVGFTISDTGEVIKADIKKSDFKNEVLNGCMIDQIKSLKLPKAPKRTVAEVQYPFVFKGK